MENNKKSCPRCDHYGPIEQDFGYRLMKGRYGRVIHPQSWCRTCRSLAQQRRLGRPLRTRVGR